MSLFFFDFWVALNAPRDGLICNPYTPAQSKHTFPFSHFFCKIASKIPYVGSFFEQFSTNIVILNEKELTTPLQKSGTPERNLVIICGPGGWRSASRARFQQHKQQLGQQQQQQQLQPQLQKLLLIFCFVLQVVARFLFCSKQQIRVIARIVVSVETKAPS